MIEELVPLLPDHTRIVSVDGFDGVGKSTFTRYLASATAGTAIVLDSFLERNQGKFLDSLRLRDLEVAMDAALNSCKTVFVEGCLVAAVLQRIDKKADLQVYVMRTTRLRSNDVVECIQEWDVLCGDKTAEELIVKRQQEQESWARMPERFGGGGSGTVPGLELELIRYHREYKPHEKADLVIKVVHWT